MAATISIVEATQPSRLIDAASAQADKAAAVAAAIDAQKGSLDGLRASWRGATADTATAKAGTDLARQRAVHTTLTNHASALRFGGANLDPLRSQILAMASQARALGGMVSDDGTVVGSGTTGVMTPVLAAAYTTSLKSMLTVFDRVDQTVADALRTGGPVVHASSPPAFTWTDADLYRGVPAGSDVNQDGVGDCYLVATMSAIANADPQWIKDRISYDPRTGLFDVTMWDGSAWRHITVTQADIDADIAAGGASGVDNGVAGAPLWPAVLESAYAKMKAPGRGVEGIERGVTPPALEALTGNNGDWIFPATEWFSTQHIDTRIADALADNQPVMLSTGVLTDDPVAPMHVYSVESITGTGSDATVTLRNPWGPGSNLPPVFDMRLGDLIGTDPLGGLGLGPTAMINIGRMGS
jgi:Calpain family cysteine protease